MSVPHNPEASIRIFNSPGPGGGTSRGSTSTPSRPPDHTYAHELTTPVFSNFTLSPSPRVTAPRVSAYQVAPDGETHGCHRQRHHRPYRRELAPVCPGLRYQNTYLTAPEVSPRTSCFWVSQPTITGTIIARVVNAESSAQNCPREVCCAATSTERGCHAMEVNETLNRNSFQAKITQSIAVEAMPARVSGMTICRSICESFTPSTWAASRISLGRSFINWYIIHTTIGVFIPTKTMMSTQTVSSSCRVLNITNKGTSTATCGSALVVMNQNTMLSLVLA